MSTVIGRVRSLHPASAEIYERSGWVEGGVLGRKTVTSRETVLE
ncbi:hypothetical protein [Chamaesiphon sp. VAR_48_metabat_403]|nr:hypothetical protein [Chamaesiphon sp. VAR_48_metabat_403]